VEVPLPLLLGAMPVVSCLAFSELAAGRGVPGVPALLCPYATGADNMNAVAKVALTRAVVVILMAYSFPKIQRKLPNAADVPRAS
jgi:hypothetical protein